MKRNLIFTFLACGASAMLSTAAQAQSPALVTSTTSTTGTSAPMCSPGAWAGHKHGEHGGGHGGILQHLTDALSLSGSQQAQIAPILQAAKPQMKAIHDNAEAQRKALIESVAGQISPLLTSDQQTKFSDLVQKFEANPGPGAGGERHFGHRGGPEAAAGPGGQGDVLQRLTTQLSLTTDQQSQIKPILDAAHTQVQAARQDTTLTQDQKFAKIKDAMEAAHSQINGILTPTQQQQLEALKAEFHHKPGPAGAPAASPSTTGTSN